MNPLTITEAQEQGRIYAKNGTGSALSASSPCSIPS